jgi:hypothetical protein
VRDLRGADAGRQVAVCGWVARRREHGEHLAFLDVRDHSGVVQCVVNSTVEVRSEFVVRVTGTVRARPDGTVNDDLSTGEVEIGDCEVEVLNRAEAPPFPVTDRVAADEVLRLRHRFVDLRRERMQRNLRLRAAVTRAMRAAMDRQGFTEVETPMLWVPTPEGSREFVVPARLQPGSFYALPQSPRSRSSCSWWAASTATTRSPAACATRTSGRPPVRVHAARHRGQLRDAGRRARLRVRGGARRSRGRHRERPEPIPRITWATRWSATAPTSPTSASVSSWSS